MRKTLAVLMGALLATGAAYANDESLTERANRTLERLANDSPETNNVVSHSAGLLVFPGVIKAGMGIGAEYGKGVLFEHGRVTGIYNEVSGSIGLQLGAQKRAQVIAFRDPAALSKFKASKGWEAGVDGSIVVADKGRGGQADTKMLNAPIVGYVLDEKGLMYNASLEGTKITQVDD